VKEFTNQDFDAIEAAVLNTARGRWFLAEHARRHRAADTATLLAAIGKLERTMVPGASQGDPGLLAGLDRIARQAADARREVAGAREALPGPSAVRIDRALDLLSQAQEGLEALIDAHAPSASAVAASPPAPLTSENLQYFSTDEELFRATERVGEAAPEGKARIKVVRTRTAGSDAGEPAAAAQPSLRPQLGQEPEERRRIVVIRGRPSQETHIPLAEADEPVSSSNPAA
jgi:hypothetical protein